MRMDAGLDTGPIVARVAVPLAGDETAPALEARLADIAADLLDRSLGPWLAGSLVPEPQAADGALLTRPLHREDGRLDPSLTAGELERRVRAFLPWPGTFVEVDGERLVVTAASVTASRTGDVAGRLVAHGDGLALAVADGRLVLDTVTPPGRRPMSGAEYAHGRRVATSMPESAR
jgi:methionyl-tRNA formyltransferase